MNDADSEYQSGVYKNTILRKGFFGKTMIVTPPMLGEYTNLTDNEIINLPKLARDRYETRLNEKEAFQKMIQNTLGAENTDGVLQFELDPGENRKIEDVIMVKNIDAQIDDKKFEYTERSVANSIRKAINNIPSILIDRSDNAMFGNSGEMLYQAQLAFQSQCEEDRSIIEEFLNEIAKHHSNPEIQNVDMKLELLINPA
jgi:hypothetical protein